MLDKEILKVKVAGEYACFTRPDLKVERMTYPCMTPSAARGVLDSILWKPEFQWWIHRIIVLKPVTFYSVKRNEIKDKQGEKPIEVDLIGKDGKPVNRAQRNSIVLKDVEYIIEASIYQKEFDTTNPPRKYAEMFKRRVKKGQCWRRPYLGTREFAAEFSSPDGHEKPISDTIPIGSILFDVFFNEKGKPSPLFFYDVAVVNGILECRNAENEKMMQSTHLKPEMDNEISSVIYNFNQAEEREAK